MAELTRDLNSYLAELREECMKSDANENPELDHVHDIEEKIAQAELWLEIREIRLDRLNKLAQSQLREEYTSGEITETTFSKASRYVKEMYQRVYRQAQSEYDLIVQAQNESDLVAIGAILE